jgi:thiamine-phosphate pyrophosphorylase
MSAMKKIVDCRLYGILDLSYVAPADIAEVAEKMIRGGIDVIQLRAKHYSEKDTIWLADQILPVTRGAGVPLVINDSPEYAVECAANGVHVGQDDIAIREARALLGTSMFIGKSTHSVDQAVAAQHDGADYIGFGPLFATPTKRDYKPIGTDEIAHVHDLVSIPVFCIGGIKIENLASVIEAGARRVVIVSGILKSKDIVGYVRESKAMLMEMDGRK